MVYVCCGLLGVVRYKIRVFGSDQLIEHRAGIGSKLFITWMFVREVEGVHPLLVFVGLPIYLPKSRNEGFADLLIKCIEFFK